VIAAPTAAGDGETVIGPGCVTGTTGVSGSSVPPGAVTATAGPPTDVATTRQAVRRAIVRIDGRRRYQERAVGRSEDGPREPLPGIIFGCIDSKKEYSSSCIKYDISYL
jgi:hypothetical protein